jgi:hypothetical protein
MTVRLKLGRRERKAAFLCSMSILAIAGSAHAQTAPAAQTQDPPQATAPADEGEILVTGSRIRRDGFQARRRSRC